MAEPRGVQTSYRPALIAAVILVAALLLVTWFGRSGQAVPTATPPAAEP